MIFISHNYKDKQVVEVIAERLSEIFGKEMVFYDSWSIQPGDGIIDKMNEGLGKATHFFFFISENSINSKMVKLEWQNAIFKASQGSCKVIPVRLDFTSMPPILAQNLYIDMYSNGIEVAISQIVNVIQGNSTYNSKSQKFSNLTYKLTKIKNNQFEITISASHFLEPIPEFIVAVENKENELKFELKNEGMFYGGFNKDITLNNGKIIDGQMMRGNVPITPNNPMTITVETLNNSDFEFLGLMHKTGEGRYEFIPRTN